MKNMLLSVAVCLTATFSASADAYDWSSVTNLAYGKTVITHGGTTTAITDGNTGSGYQKKIDGVTNEFFILDFGEETAVTHFGLYWEASHPITFNLYVTNEVKYSSTIDGGADYNELDSEWIATLEAAATGGENSSASYDELLTGSFSGRYYIVYVTENNSWSTTYGNQPYEFLAAYIDSSTTNNLATTFTMSDVEAVKGASATVTVSVYTLGGDLADLSRVSNLTLTADNSEVVTITSTETTGTYTVSASDYGVYTLTATGTSDDSDGSTITGTCTFTSTFDWTNNTNVACVTNNENAYAYVSSNESTAQNAIDGNVSSNWQASGTTDGEYLYVDLGAQYTITALTLECENAYPTKYTYDYANSVDDNGDLVWTTIATVEKTLTWTANHYESPYELSESVVAQYIRVTQNELALAYGMNIYEFRAAGEYYAASQIGTDNINTITLTLADTEVYKGGSTTLTAKVYKKNGDEVTISSTDFAFASSDSVTIVATETAGEYTVTANNYGIYTITATCTSDDVAKTIITGTCTLSSVFDWTAYDNVALEKTAYASSEENAGNAASNAIDGNTGTRWASAYQSTDASPWFYVDLGAAYNIYAITATWESAYAKGYTYYYATETGSDGNPTWIELGSVSSTWTWAANNYEEPYELENSVQAQYVKIAVTEFGMSTYGVSIYEFRVAGTLVDPTVTVTPEYNGLLIGETVTLNGVVSSGDYVYENANITYTIDSEDYATISDNVLTATAKGKVTVTATYAGTSATTTVTVAADPDEEVDRYAVTVDAYSGSDVGDFVMDGNSATAWMTSDEDAETTHTLILTLHSTYDLDLVRIYWGENNSCAYTLSVAPNKTLSDGSDYDYTQVYTYSAEASATTRTDRIYSDVLTSDATMDGTDYVKLISTSNNAANAGLTIYEIECYGPQSEEITSGIGAIALDSEAVEEAPVNVYNINGTMVRQGVTRSEATYGLTPGFYIVGNEKVFVK